MIEISAAIRNCAETSTLAGCFQHPTSSTTNHLKWIKRFLISDFWFPFLFTWIFVSFLWIISAMVVMEGDRTWYEGSTTTGATQHPNSPLPSGASQHHQDSSGAEADSYFKGSAAASQYFSQAAAMQSAYGGINHGKIVAACVCVFMCPSVFVSYVCIYLCLYMCVCLCICVCVNGYLCLCVCMHAYVFVCVCVHVCVLYVCMCVRVNAYLCISM